MLFWFLFLSPTNPQSRNGQPLLSVQLPTIVIGPTSLSIAVTSQITAPSQIGTFLVKDWKAAGLLKPSVVKPIITTLQKTLVKKKLGRLIGQDIERLQDALQSIFGDRS
jgi:hypothetical protein